MSWSRMAALAAAASGLSGCFTPLYSETAHPGLVEDVIADINGTGETASPPKYRLAMKIATGVQTPTVNSETNVASSATMSGDVEYVLTRVDGNAEVVKGTANAAAAYDRTTQRYADLRAARDAEIRLARALSQEISLRLASALAAKSP